MWDTPHHRPTDLASSTLPINLYLYSSQFHGSLSILISKKILDVTCAIIIDGPKVLVTQRSEIMKLPLKWEFPGGKIDSSETPEACIARELMEELNITVEIINRLSNSQYDYDNFTVNLIPFVARLAAGELILREHKAFKWATVEELKFLDWAPADIPVLDNFLKSEYAPGRPV